MPKTSQPRGTLAIAALVALALLSGCEATGNWLKGRRTAEPAEAIDPSAPEANAYLDELHRLAGGDPATQAEIFADAESAAMLTPGTSTQLRYALVLALPGHSGSNAGEAQGMLRELLARPELMNATENALAAVFLTEVETRLVLEAEARRLRSDSTRAAMTEEAAVAQRIARVEAENRRLRQSLADAEAKLEAIMTIERSIRQQAGQTDPR